MRRMEQPFRNSNGLGAGRHNPQDGPVFPCPQVRGRRVIQNSSTGPSGLRSSLQVRCLWTCAQQLSTGCGKLTVRQWADRVVHRLSPGNRWLSPGSPQLYPQFDNTAQMFTPRCERRHVVVLETGG